MAISMVHETLPREARRAGKKTRPHLAAASALARQKRRERAMGTSDPGTAEDEDGRALRVLIADDHPLFRDGLRSLLEAGGVEVVGEAGSALEATELARDCQPDIVLMDARMPGLSGLAVIPTFSKDMPDVKVVVLTASEDDADLVEAMQSGAHGYLLKNLESEQFFALLNGVNRGELALAPGLTRRLLSAINKPKRLNRQQSPDSLTERELEVVRLLVEGQTSNRVLADRLVVTENTIKYHLRNIFDKLQVSSRAQVIALAVQNRLIAASQAV